ncbi:MAG: hypothetical protein OXL34_18415 [Gemmatimonadota bacterium]|nr:hypothetical protein [Gemmatimonadota bacterium]
MSANTRSSTDDNDGRDLFDPETKYSDDLRKEQRCEGLYIWLLFVIALVALAGVALGDFVSFVPDLHALTAQRFTLAALGGLLGGVVYAGKWLYHSIARGLWHQDRRMWRILSPWMSVGTTIGIWSLMNIGFFPAVSQPATGIVSSLALPVGTGFVIGYLSDRCLAKMKELTEVLFGSSEIRERTSVGTTQSPTAAEEDST